MVKLVGMYWVVGGCWYKPLGVKNQHYYQDECPLEPSCNSSARQNAPLGHNMSMHKGQSARWGPDPDFPKQNAIV